MPAKVRLLTVERMPSLNLMLIVMNVIGLSHQFHQREFLNINTKKTDMSIFKQLKCFNTTKLLRWSLMSTAECGVQCGSHESDWCKFVLFNKAIDKMKSECILCICTTPGLDEYTVAPEDYEYSLIGRYVGWYDYAGYSGKHAFFTSRVSGRGNRIGPVCLCVCLSVCLSVCL